MKKFFHSKRKRKLKQILDIGLLNYWRLKRRRQNKHVYIDSTVAVYIDDLIASRGGVKTA